MGKSETDAIWLSRMRSQLESLYEYCKEKHIEQGDVWQADMEALAFSMELLDDKIAETERRYKEE